MFHIFVKKNKVEPEKNQKLSPTDKDLIEPKDLIKKNLKEHISSLDDLNLKGLC